MRIQTVSIAVTVGLLLVGCFPYTSVPMVALSGYDLLDKRERWHTYADQGDVYAQFELAESYANNSMEGSLDTSQAFDWYCKAAKNGYGKAQMIVGELYERKQALPGIVVASNLPKAHAWYSLAKRRSINQAWERLEHVESQMNKQEIKRAKKILRDYRKMKCGMEDKDVQLEKKD